LFRIKFRIKFRIRLKFRIRIKFGIRIKFRTRFRIKIRINAPIQSRSRKRLIYQDLRHCVGVLLWLSKKRYLLLTTTI